MNSKSAKKSIDLKAIAAYRVLQTEDGQTLYSALKFEFDTPSLVGETVEQTYFNLGRRDALSYIDELLTHAQRLQKEEKNEKNIPSSFNS